MPPDILEQLVNLHKQATVERSHFYVASVVTSAAVEILRLRSRLARIEHDSESLLNAARAFVACVARNSGGDLGREQDCGWLFNHAEWEALKAAVAECEVQ